MKISLAAVMPRRTRSKSEATDRLLADYIERSSRYLPCESQTFEDESAFLAWLTHQSGRSPIHAILLDSRGRQFSSEEFAARLGTLRDSGTQPPRSTRPASCSRWDESPCRTNWPGSCSPSRSTAP